MRSPTLNWALIQPATPKCPCNLRLAHGPLAFLTLNQDVPHTTVYEVNFNSKTCPEDFIFFPFDSTSPALTDWIHWLHQEYDSEINDHDFIIRVTVSPTN